MHDIFVKILVHLLLTHLFLVAQKEGSGKAGCRYEHVEGDLVFEKGVFERTIDIRILENALWTATLEFKVLLEEPIRCHLGCLKSTRKEQFQQ